MGIQNGTDIEIAQWNTEMKIQNETEMKYKMERKMDYKMEQTWTYTNGTELEIQKWK